MNNKKKAAKTFIRKNKELVTLLLDLIEEKEKALEKAKQQEDREKIVVIKKILDRLYKSLQKITKDL